MQVVSTIKQVEKFLWDKKYNLSHKKNLEYVNIICSFDIETTSVYKSITGDDYISNSDFQKLEKKHQKNFEKCAFMYIFQFLIDDIIFIGRCWNDFQKICSFLVNWFNTEYNERHLIVYVHNLSYEFQFMRNWLQFVDVFAIQERKPMKAITQQGLEFRCSYILSGYSLDTLAKNLQSHKIKKLKGDLDYNLIHNSNTVLSSSELQYCINDVVIVKYFIQECIERFGNITSIPLTQTGIVRNYVRNYTMKDKKFYFWIKNITMDSNEFLILKRAFAGGYTHTNIRYVDEKIKNVSSIDFTSSYPYALLSEKYPMSKGIKLKYKITKAGFLELVKNTLCVFDATFYNIKSKDYIDIISLHKCFERQNIKVDNGKIISGDKISISLTNIDFLDICDFYDFDNFEISNIYTYTSNYLPKKFCECIIKFYTDKTTLKGVVGKEKEYLHGKEMLNSLYGMCVTNIIRDDIIYENNNWISQECNIDTKINDYNDNKNRFLCYIWGVFCTAYARHNLYTGIKEFKNDFIYCDTDSIKCINYEKHLDYIEKYNYNCVKKLEKMCDYHKFNYSVFRPKTVKGVEKILGLWDYEGIYTYFKALGAKRYLYEIDNELHLTVAGLGKKSIETLSKNYSHSEIFELFTNGFYIPRGDAGKLTHTYCDREIKGKIKDYKGVESSFYEKSFIHLEESEFLLTLTDDYTEIIFNVKNIFK